MKVLLDADMPAHEIGHIKVETGLEDADGKPILKALPWHDMKKLAVGQFFHIVYGSQASGWKAFLTRGENFRNDLATILPYKGNREHSPRDEVDSIKKVYHEELGAHWCEGFEADDAMAMEQWADLADSSGMNGEDPQSWDWAKVQQNATTVIASRDKDLRTVPGWHFTWWLTNKLKKKKEEADDGEKKTGITGEISWISYEESQRNFYTQMLTGDTADNIHGLYNIGLKSAWVKQLGEMEDEESMYEHVEEKYTNYFKGYATKFLLETARLLHMWRRPNDEWMPPHMRDDKYWELGKPSFIPTVADEPPPF